jgi:prepilin-type N-terminal cleavage/methylation domain-containing protein
MNVFVPSPFAAAKTWYEIFFFLNIDNSISEPRIGHRKGFSLVELLVVLAIVAILSSFLLLSVSGIKGSRDLSNAAYSIQGALEQARTVAMATSTYTWVGFFEENPASPGTAGTGQVVISIIASVNGVNLFTGSPRQFSATELAELTQVSKLLKIPNVHLTSVAANAVAARPSIVVSGSTPTDTYQVGSSDFPNPSSASPTASANWNFPYPLSTGTSQYTFYQIIQFNPQGDATRIADYPTQVMEVGLQPSHGQTVASTGTNYAVIQIAGIGGHVTTYRP